MSEAFSLRLRWTSLCAVLLFGMLGVVSASAQVRKSSAVAAYSTTSQQARLEAFLRHYVGPQSSEDNRDTRYESAFVDLTGHGAHEAIVYLMGRQWCGSGGCTTLVLAPRGTSYRVVAYLTTTWPPIRVLARESQGWHDIAVWAQGGGVQPGYETDLYFNGRTYRGRDNATMHPSKRLRERKLTGKTVIPSTPRTSNAPEIGKPLYP